jgi:hypothetical protein
VKQKKQKKNLPFLHFHVINESNKIQVIKCEMCTSFSAFKLLMAPENYREIAVYKTESTKHDGLEQVCTHKNLSLL